MSLESAIPIVLLILVLGVIWFLGNVLIFHSWSCAFAFIFKSKRQIEEESVRQSLHDPDSQGK